MSNLNFIDYIQNREITENANVLSLFSEYIAWLVQACDNPQAPRTFTIQQLLFQLQIINAYLIGHYRVHHKEISTIALHSLHIPSDVSQAITHKAYVSHVKNIALVGLPLLAAGLSGVLLMLFFPISSPVLFYAAMMIAAAVSVSGLGLCMTALLSSFSKTEPNDSRVKSDIPNFPRTFMVAAGMILAASACVLSYLPAFIAATSPLAPILLVATVAVLITAAIFGLSFGIGMSNHIIDFTAPEMENVTSEMANSFTSEIDRSYALNNNQLDKAVLATTKCLITSNLGRGAREEAQSDVVDIEFLNQELKRVSVT